MSESVEQLKNRLGLTGLDLRERHAKILQVEDDHILPQEVAGQLVLAEFFKLNTAQVKNDLEQIRRKHPSSFPNS